jgi:hypothetical protein
MMRPGDHMRNPAEPGSERLIALAGLPGSWPNRAEIGISVAFPLTAVAGAQVRGHPVPGQVIEQDGRAA